MPISHQRDVTMQRGDLMIDGQKYMQMVDPPSAKQVMLSSKEQKDEFRRVKVHIGPEKTHGTSKFYAYIAEVNNFNEIKEAYMKIKDANLGASHIPCRYQVFGADFPTKQDFADDFEHGAGRTILDQLQLAGVFNVAVFIVRYYDGTHIGRARFDIMKQLTRDAIAEFPGKLNYGQNFQNQGLLKALKQANKPYRRESPSQLAETSAQNQQPVRGRGGRGR